MSDLIDRQAAKDVVDMELDAIDHVPERVYDRLLTALDKVPTIEPEQHWIPLADKEPTEEGEYLVTFDDGFVATTGYYDGDFELWADAGEPIAWMPLPEPYQPKEE